MARAKKTETPVAPKAIAYSSSGCPNCDFDRIHDPRRLDLEKFALCATHKAQLVDQVKRERWGTNK